jgi:hypothetical protein
MRLLADPDNADHGIQKIIHDHAPTSYIAQRRINLLPNVGEGGTRAGVHSRHASIADGGEKHRNHGDENRGHNVAPAAVTEDAEY